MAFIDVAITAGFGFVLLLWPSLMFVGSRVTPDAGRIRLIRRGGITLLGIAAAFLVIRLAG